MFVEIPTNVPGQYTSLYLPSYWYIVISNQISSIFSSLDLKYECNANCSCGLQQHTTVCIEALGVHFYNPCFAGCTGEANITITGPKGDLVNKTVSSIHKGWWQPGSLEEWRKNTVSFLYKYSNLNKLPVTVMACHVSLNIILYFLLYVIGCYKFSSINKFNKYWTFTFLHAETFWFCKILTSFLENTLYRMETLH